MPSRLVVFAIVVFWLVSTGWLVVREVVPRFRTGEPPAFFTDVTDEVGGTTIMWNILHKGKNVGGGDSSVERRSDRTFVLSSNLRFDNFDILFVKLKRISGHYRVDKHGNLKELSTEVRLDLPGGEIRSQVKGVVKGGILVPRIFIHGEETDLGLFQPQPVNVAAHGNVLNSMHLLNKIPGLRVGQSWEVPLLDPLGGILPGRKTTAPTLLAEVHAAELVWQKEPVACFRIDYAELGKKATAHTWVRRSDGLVLQQEARRDELDLVLVREVSK
jgi:hypothetical protein